MVIERTTNKKVFHMDWLKARVKEVSSWSGAGLIVLGDLIILGDPFVNLLAWNLLSHGASSQSGRKTNIMFGQLKLILIAITLLGGLTSLVYVYKLKADNAILKENQIKLEQSVASQKEVIAQQKEDFETILNANKELTELKAKLDKELDLH